MLNAGKPWYFYLCLTIVKTGHTIITVKDRLGSQVIKTRKSPIKSDFLPLPPENAMINTIWFFLMMVILGLQICNHARHDYCGLMMHVSFLYYIIPVSRQLSIPNLCAIPLTVVLSIVCPPLSVCDSH